ncbi:hypothetical protein VNO78_26499 [Psophocarpus tetragonolobus]|uniref:Uncharacterized protein n=1 Tax=Psophocarpus tetragonolobus TaxID=3891 RepID=A0AAN9X924_PSOTE
MKCDLKLALDNVSLSCFYLVRSFGSINKIVKQFEASFDADSVFNKILKEKDLKSLDFYHVLVSFVYCFDYAHFWE